MSDNHSVQLVDLAHTIVDQAKQFGATASEVTITVESGLAVNVHQNTVETLEQSSTRNVALRVYYGKHVGSASTSVWSDVALKDMLEKASYIARFTEEDPYVGLAEPQLMAYNYPQLDLAYPWHITPYEAIELAKNCEAISLNYDKRIINTEGAAVNSSNLCGVYANSHNFCGTIATTQHSISCVAIAKEQQEMQRDYYYICACDHRDLLNYADVAKSAAKRTLQRLGARKIPTQKCPVIFAAEVASSIINSLIRALDGYKLYRHASFLYEHLHQQIFPETITISEDPFLPKALGSAPFDAEGVKLERSDIVSAGILRRYILDSYSARKLKMSTTGNAGGIHNILVTSGTLDLDGLCHKMEKGLLVTELLGGDTNIVTGDYSCGIFGYWVEHGVIQYPVTGVTIAGNIKQMFRDIVDIGTDIDKRSKILTGSILIAEMTAAGE